MKDIVAASVSRDYCLHLRFEDGVEGVVDLAPYLSFQGVFEPLRNPAYFAQVRVVPELGSVAWPNGADLDPDVLYGRLTGTREQVVRASANDREAGEAQDRRETVGDREHPREAAQPC